MEAMIEKELEYLLQARTKLQWMFRSIVVVYRITKKLNSLPTK